MQREEITARLAGLSPAKRALLERRRRGEAPAAQVFTIGRRTGTGPAPLSFSQQRMWFLDQLAPGSPAYNLRVLLQLSGPLDRRALARSFQEVVHRHEVLRTAFREEDGVPVQAVLPHLALELPLLDLTALPADRREQESLRRTRELAVASFDLSRPPLLRVALVELDGSAHHLFVGMHHIVSDGWSMGVLVREVAALYAAFLADAPPSSASLPELPIQYADFAVWQRGWLTGEVLERDLGYWRERLAGAATELDLPTDRPRPAVQTSHGAAWRFAFDAGLMAAVEALARREGATPFMVLTAGLLTLLARLSGQGDLTLGSPAAGRNRPETEGLIGFFVNTLVLRADVTSAPDFLALLAHVREVTLGAYGHQDVPFEKLVAEIAPERDMSRTPLFQVAFALQNTAQGETISGAALAGLELRPEQLPVDNAKFDLAFIVGGESGPLAASLEYATDLFDRTTAARLCGQWLRLLAAATADPETDLARLELLSAAERHQILAEWNDTRDEALPGRDDLLHEPFERQADLRPEALAAVWGTESATYRELEARVNRLASFLQRLGAGPGAPVGVWMDRSLDMVAALLGASKAGAAYLPIDAGWPADRAEAVLAGTGAGIVLTRRDHLPAVQALQWKLPNLADAVCLDVADPQPPPEPVDAAAVQGLFDGVSERAVDWVTAAGFYSAYTGEPFSEAEVLEYRDRVIGLAAPWIGKDKRVLEIGSGSGLILWELAPRVGRYVGLDPSPRTQELNRQRAEREGYGNAEFPTGFAHDVETLARGSFDLVILASTTQFFPGLNYLENVLETAMSLLAPGGAVIVADVLDPRRREDFLRSLAEHPHGAAARTLARQGEARELYVDPGYFAQLSAQVLPREEGFANELRFRYDVVIQKTALPAVHQRRKRVWTGWHVAAASDARPARAASPVDVAYVIHTSGSTGAPKGIVVQHRPAVDLVRWINTRFGVGPDDRLLFITSPAFDLSVYDVFGVLAAGGTVHVAPEEALRDPEEMVRLLAEEPVTVWDSAPAALQQLAPLFPERTDQARLRLVMLSGDWIPVRLPDRVRASFPKARVMALGGATEATVWSNWFPVREIDPRWPSIPYGRPITNAQYHVLDRALQPCPIGIPGDLYIGGDCLCVGYARLPAMTAERFIPDPFAAGPGARLYTTGDRARYGTDGNLEFLGRVDQQVKVRGYRIELEEIEAVLARLPGVREAAVVAREDIPGDKRLVGYVVPAVSPAPTSHELRAALQRVMPEYMVPWAFVTMESLPVTANGKLDRKALPAPQETAESEAEYEAPDTDVERGIAAIWQEVLRLQRVGRQDNFFELGGSSLVATQVTSRLRQAFGVEIPLRTLFEDRTLAALAQRVEELRGTAMSAGGAAPPLIPQPRTGPVPLSFAQQRLWLIDQLEPGSPRYNIAGAARLTGPLDPGLFGRILQQVVRRHESLRTTFAMVDAQPVQVIAAEREIALPVVDLSGLPAGDRRVREAEVMRRAAAEARLPFDLARGPLLRATLLRLGGAEHVALLTFHHIVADAWSMGVLFREIVDLHARLPLPGLPVQYADFALWQRGWLGGEALERELAYWRTELAGAPAVLELPTDRPRPAVQSFRGGSRTVVFPASLVAPLAAWGQGRGATPFMVLLGVFAAWLGRVSGQAEVVVGSPIAGRDRQEIEGLIGFFVNTLPLRVDLSGAPCFGPLLDRVRGMALDAFAHQSLPFERLVDELAPVRDLSHTPLFQVMFALQNAPFGRLELPGLTLTPLNVAHDTAKFDLTLSLSEEPEGLVGFLEYNRDLFDEATPVRIVGHLETLLAGLAADPDRRLSELPLLTAGERAQVLREWNDTRAPFPETTLLHQFFEAAAERSPEAVALVCNGSEMTFAQLEARTNRLARLLRDAGVGRGTPVGVWVERSLDLPAAVYGVLKAGGHYLALDAGWPAGRIEAILARAGAPAVIAGPGLLPAVEEMRWRLPELSDVVCLGIADPEPPVETIDPASVRELWDYVAERATDRVTAGGFISAFTGLPFSEAEVDEYRDRVLDLARPWLRPEARVLEVGSGSGLLLWDMASRVAHVTGVDPSPLTQERNRERQLLEGWDNVELLTGFAHELDGLLAAPAADKRFDLVLLASTVQFFPGPRYLEQVVKWALSRLMPGGALLIADVLDPRRRDELRQAIAEFRGDAEEEGVRRRELHLDEDLFRDLGAALPEAAEVSVLHRREGFPNELRYRYDVLFTRAAEGMGATRERRKRLWTGWHVEACPAARLPQVTGPDDFAYVMHTSGSTGEPKSIAVQHRPAANLVHWVNRTLRVGPGDRGLFVTSIAFDLSVYDMFGMPGAGAAIRVATDEEMREPERLAAVLRHEEITFWNSAPAALVRLAALFPETPDVASRLRLVLLSGDWIPVTLPDRVRQAFPGAHVVSLGGATEATIWSNWYPVGAVDPHWSSIPYGRPMANASYYVLDAGLAPCPIGVPGDLYVGGDCLCVGYARRPDLTAAVFLPDPFSERPGARMYRFGDRARFGADGNMEFLGRVDQQVKVRGFRIELGEIEVALARHPGVREAVVLAREDRPGDRRLVAYIVPSEEPAPEAEELRVLLLRSLPEYMVPAAFVTLDHLPVTANGKLDRQALPAPDWGAHEEADALTPLEESLAAIWSEVLGLEQVGREHSFFDLGGHSLLAMQMVARVRQELGVDLVLRQLFAAPTIARLAGMIEDARGEASTALAVVPGRWAAGEPLPLSYAQQRFWFLQQLNPSSSAFNLSGAVRLIGRLDAAALEAAFGEIVRRHAVVRTRFVAVDGLPRQIVEPPRAFTLPVADLSGLRGRKDAELRRLAAAEAHRPFDLAAGTLRVLLVHLAPPTAPPEIDEHVVLFALHHIAGDGWSLQVLTRELGDLYTAAVEGRLSPLPELPVQYVDWAAAQQEWLRGPGGAEQLAYWRRRLGGELPVLTFPMQRQRPAAPRFLGAAQSLSLDTDLSAAVTDLGRREGATLFMVLLAAFQALLHLTTGEEDLLVGTNIANRDQPGVGGLIGLFVNDLVLRVDAAGRPSFRQLLARVHETAVEAFAHQDLPYEALVADLRPDRSAGPLFQVMFVLQGFPMAVRELPGLTLEPLQADYQTANFDLTLTLGEGPDGLSGAFIYDVDLFDASTVARLAEHFVALLREVVADPDRPLHSLSFEPVAAARQMANAFSEDL